ncbi:hypothetical protein CPB83DRAFT_782282 [Crepidotus variabilis]|uniref:Uncharacterized protein n=1 Tax=Crepidotus variabilis TaxID=179855 RepID=A0A9P6EQY1_9AGAR|nr:hypothetical protein CPB83DRAFT_782282 [Crepidotus variabilis]
MQLPHFAALGVFSVYFLIIAALFIFITKDLQSLASVSSSSIVTRLVFVALTVASFAHTWFYMFYYMAWSFADYGKGLQLNSPDSLTHVASWLHDTSLFEQAWALVCFNPQNWWWSEQLCLFTAGTWTIFLVVEGKRYGVKHLWAYMLLGQIVAISVASNMFYLAILLSQRPDVRSSASPRTVGLRIWLSVLLSLATIAASPYTSRQIFLYNLLAMHALLFVPLFPFKSSRSLWIDIKTLYNIVYIASLAIHFKTSLVAFRSLILSHTSFQTLSLEVALSAWNVLFSNPAQSSIGWDVIWTSISFITWILLRPASSGQPLKYLSVPYLVAVTPLASVGVTAPYILQPRGDESGKPISHLKRD